MMCHHAKEQMAAAWQGDLSPAAEEALKQHLKECGDCAAEMALLTGLWERLGDLPAPEPSQALHVRWQSTLESVMGSSIIGSSVTSRAPGAALAKSGRAWSFTWLAHLWPRNPAWQAGIAFACLILGLAAGRFIPSASQTGKSSNGEIAELHREIASTRAMVALSLLQQQSATERLRGVDYSVRMPAMEPEIVSALIQAVNSDSSVNVRLAAIDALSRTAGNPGVLSALTRSLPTQDSPMVQAALVDYLVDAHDLQAVSTLRQLAGQPDVNPAVLERTRSALHQLSQ